MLQMKLRSTASVRVQLLGLTLGGTSERSLPSCLGQVGLTLQAFVEASSRLEQNERPLAAGMSTLRSQTNT